MQNMNCVYSHGGVFIFSFGDFQVIIINCTPLNFQFNFGVTFSLFSTSVESRTEKLLSVRMSVRTMPLISANSYQITSILHTVLSTVTVSVFIEEKKLNRPSPYFGVFFSETLGHRFQPI